MEDHAEEELATEDDVNEAKVESKWAGQTVAAKSKSKGKSKGRSTIKGESTVKGKGKNVFKDVGKGTGYGVARGLEDPGPANEQLRKLSPFFAQIANKAGLDAAARRVQSPELQFSPNCCFHMFKMLPSTAACRASSDSGGPGLRRPSVRG